MARTRHIGLALGLALAAGAAPALAQDALPRDKPAPFVPLRPETRQELDHREALRQYALAALHQRENRLIAATHAFEQAAWLEPDSAASYKALFPLYLALDRLDDALAACRQALDLEPGDFELWGQLARQLRALNRGAEAVAALRRGVACAGLKDRPDLKAQMYFDLGILHEQAQEFKEAEGAFRQVAAVLDNPQALMEVGAFSREEIDAQAAETYERLGRACLKLGHPDQAVKDFVQAQKRDPGRAPRLAYNLADVYRGQGKLTEALASLDTYLASQPQGTEAYEKKIAILRELGRDAEVLPALQRAAAADRHNEGLKLLLARAFAEAGRGREAEELYLKVAEESPTPEVYKGLFALYQQQGRAGLDRLLDRLDAYLVKAAEARDKHLDPPPEAARARSMLLVLRDDPKLAAALMPLVTDRLTKGRLGQETRYFFAFFAARAKQLDEAERLFRSLIARGAGPAGRGPQEHEAYVGLLQVLWEGKKHEGIVEVCRQGLEGAQATSRVYFHVQAAHALQALGRMNEAVAEATHAADLAADKDRLACRRLKAQMLAEAGRTDQAVAECLALLKEYQEPGQVREVRLALSSIYSAVNESAKAEELLLAILKADPNDATANNNLGYLWADLGKNLDDAERMIRKALDLERKARQAGSQLSAEGDSAAYVDSLGWVLFRRGKLDEARQELERAVRLPGGDDDPTVWDHLGDVCFRQKDAARARAAWQKAVDLYQAGRRKSDDRGKEITQKLKLLE